MGLLMPHGSTNGNDRKEGRPLVSQYPI